MELYRGAVAGVKFYPSQTFGIKPLDPLTLIAEASNPHDRRAIRVEHKGRTIGYIPRDSTAKLHDAKAAGSEFRASVVSYNKANPSWDSIIILVEATTAKEHNSDVKF